MTSFSNSFGTSLPSVKITRIPTPAPEDPRHGVTCGAERQHIDRNVVLRHRTRARCCSGQYATRVTRQSCEAIDAFRSSNIELLAVADEVESAIILACGLNASGPAVRLDAAIHLRFDPNISQKAQAGNRRRCRYDRGAAGGGAAVVERDHVARLHGKTVRVLASPAAPLLMLRCAISQLP